MIDWNTFFAFNRIKGILTLTLLVIGFIVPFTYQESGCSITGVGFPAPMYTKTRIGCQPTTMNLRDFYQFNILAIGFNLLIFYIISCILITLYTTYGKHH